MTRAVSHTTAWTPARPEAVVLVDQPTDNNTRRYPRTLAEAYPCERAAAIEGPYRAPGSSPWWWVATAALVTWCAWFTVRLMGGA